MISAATCLKTIAFPVSRKPEPSEPGVRGGAERQSEFSHALCSMRTHVSASLLVVAAIAVADFGTLQAATYYVNNEHYNMDDTWLNAQNLVDSPWETIQEAAERVVANDIVYVKATSTPYDPFVMKTSGSDHDLIEFIGYYNTPGDLDDGSGVIDGYGDIDFANDGVPKGYIKKSPIINGQNRAGPTGVDFKGHGYIELRNFWVTNCKLGVFCDGAFCTIKNVYVWNTGDRMIFSGRGIGLYGDSNIVDNCVCYNAGNQAFEIVGPSNPNAVSTVSSCKIKNSRCYSDDDNGVNKFAETHYYFLIANGNDNTIENCVAGRYFSGTPTPHGGHGFVIQADTANQPFAQEATRNTVRDCVCYEIAEPFVLRGRVTDNHFWDCEADIEDDEQVQTLVYENGKLKVNWTGAPRGCITGPYDNGFHRVGLFNSDVGVAFFGSDLIDPNADVAGIAAANNTFENCVFECEIGIQLFEYSDEEGVQATDDDLTDGETDQDVNGNGFANCTFIGDPTNAGHNVFFYSARESSGNLLVNCVIYGFDEYVVGSPITVNEDYTPLPISTPEFKFDFCCIWDPIADEYPSAFPDKNSLGVGNLDEDPDFPNWGNFTPTVNSPCIDEGMPLFTLFDWDYYGLLRYDGNMDIGAVEVNTP